MRRKLPLVKTNLHEAYVMKYNLEITKMQMQRSKVDRGMVLGIVVITSMLMAVFIFSYHHMVSQQNKKAHHDQLGEVGARLALTGVNMLAEYINSGFDPMIQSLAAPLLVTAAIPADKKFPGVVSGSGGVLDRVFNDFNIYLSQLDNLRGSAGNAPVCTKMEVAFENCEKIFPSTSVAQMLSGRDPVEKSGEVILSCTVEYMSLLRKAEIRRQFKVVSMVPGVFARFTLFVPYTPWPDSYNALGVNFNGTVDGTYVHPIPSLRSFTNPLKIFNGTDSFVPGTAPDAKQDLKNRGWVFLGPSPVPALNSSVLLKIPSGYSAAAGGHFLFASGAQIVNPMPPPAYSFVVPPETLDPGTHYRLDNSPNYKSSLGGVYQGFYTYDPDGAKKFFGAGWPGAGPELWPDLTSDTANSPPNDRNKCAASWLFPYGNLVKPSRTLIVGNVLAGFLKFYFIKDALNLPMKYRGKLRGKISPSSPGPGVIYDPNQKLDCDYGSVDAPKFLDVFLQPSFGADQGYSSFQTVFPHNFSPTDGALTPGTAVAFNSFFDCLNYPGDRAPVGTGWSYPGFGSSLYIPFITLNSALADPFYVPRYTDLSPAGGVNGLHPSDLTVRFTPTDGATPLDNHYFDGELCNYRVLGTPDHINRMTHRLDLTNCTSSAQEKNQLENRLFTRKLSYTPPIPHSGATNGTWYIPKQSGVYYVMRRPGLPAGDALEFPGNIFLDKSLIIYIDDQNVRVNNKILSSYEDGAPDKLLSIIALNGNIELGTSDEIDAYLVALKPGSGGSSPGGRLLARPGITRMKIFGGLAIWEMGLYQSIDPRTTMGDFTDGGEIRYNPRFNPGNEIFYAKSRIFIMEDKASSIVLGGGG